MKTQEMTVPDFYVLKNQAINGNKRGLVKQQRISEAQLLLTIVIDFLLLNASIFGMIAWQLSTEEIQEIYFNQLVLFMGIVNVTAIIIATFSSIYTTTDGVKLNLRIKELFWTTLLFFGIISLVYYQFFYIEFDIHFLVPALIIFLGVSTFIHVGIRYFNRNQSGFLSYAVVGGTPYHLKYLEDVLEATYGKHTFCLGRFGHNEIPGLLSLGNFEDIEFYLRKNNNISKLLYFDSPLSIHEVQQLGQLCRSKFIDFEVVPNEVAFFNKGTQIEQIEHLPILRRKKEPLLLLKNRILKRIFDIIFSTLVIVLIFPWLFPVIALLIKLESKGPVFFVQYRTGYWNKPFRCLKFRSMTVNENADTLQATKNDTRITRIGAFLRKTNLDELPQFFNVFVGDMSVVGPRPHMLKHTEDYSQLIDTFMIRHEAKPGITGWAQVNGWRGPTEQLSSMEKRVEFDVNYIENWGFWFDCKIIFMTILNVFGSDENAF